MLFIVDYRNLLHRLYRTKMALIATLGISIGTVLLFVAEAGFPIKELGSGLFTTGIVAIVFEYFETRDADQRDRQRLRDIIHEQAPVIRDSVIDGFAVDHTTLATVASTETLDRIVENSIAARLGDHELASDLYTDLKQQVLTTAERHYDTHATVTLSPWENGPASGVGAMFVATVRWDYRTSGLAGVRRFASTSDQREYQQLARDPSTTKAWFLDPHSGITTEPTEVFHLVEYTLDGAPQPIQRAARPGTAIFTVSADASGAGERHVSYTYRVLVPRHGHLLFLDINKPSKGLRATLTHHDSCGIRYLNQLPLIASTRNARIHRNTETVPAVDIGFDGWIMPGDGIAYTWSLNTEFAH